MTSAGPADSPPAMKAEPNLDQLTTALGQCLGRIDAEAFELQRQAEAGAEECQVRAADAFEREGESLEELVGSLLLATAPPEHCNLNQVLGSTLGQSLRSMPGPVLVRQRIDPNLPLIGCGQRQLASTVQRALLLGIGHLEVGDELRVATRVDGDCVLLEIEACGGHPDPHLGSRSQTLCEFAATLRGHCRVAQDEHHHLLIVVELPMATVTDSSGSPQRQ
jgi:hypothetical protein